MPTKYKKKPVTIEAVQWVGHNMVEIGTFLNQTPYFNIEGNLVISTLEGDHIANINDYVIKGVKGEFYPCKPDIFAATYDKVED